MTTYFFDLCHDIGTAADETGFDFPDSMSALEYGHQVARELMRNNGPKSRAFCLQVRDENGQVLSVLPLAEFDDAISHLPSETRALLRTCFERRRKLSEAVRAAREAIQKSRATVARAHGKPYLAAANGKCYR